MLASRAHLRAYNFNINNDFNDPKNFNEVMAYPISKLSNIYFTRHL